MEISGIGVATDETLAMCLIPPDDLIHFKFANKVPIESSFNGTMNVLQFSEPSQKLGCPGMPCLAPGGVWVTTSLFSLFDLHQARFHAL